MATSAGLPVSFTVQGAAVVNPLPVALGLLRDLRKRRHEHHPDRRHRALALQRRPRPLHEGTFVAPDRLEGVVVAPSRELPECPQTRATFVAAPGLAPPPKEPKVYVVKDLNTGRPAVEPSEIILGKHRSFGFRELRWRDFGDSRAVAQGRAFIRRGKHVSRPGVTVRLRFLVEHDAEFKSYLELRHELHGRIPPGIDRRGSRALP